MLPRAAGNDETTREGGETMGLESLDLLGLGLLPPPPPTMGHVRRWFIGAAAAAV
jgi:hypothetical protein